MLKFVEKFVSDETDSGDDDRIERSECDVGDNEFD
jgi:hypothetical protein